MFWRRKVSTIEAAFIYSKIFFLPPAQDGISQWFWFYFGIDGFVFKVYLIHSRLAGLGSFRRGGDGAQRGLRRGNLCGLRSVDRAGGDRKAKFQHQSA